MERIKKVSLLIILTVFCSFMSFETYFDLNAKELANQQFKWLAIDSIFAILLFILTYLIYKKTKHSELEVTLKNKIVITIGFTFLALLINHSYGLLIDTTPNQELINAAIAKAPILVAFQTRLFAPITEEIIWRGIFMNLFFTNNTKLAKFMRVFLSGLLFGFVHTYSFGIELLLYSIIGWVLASVYHFTKDVRCPIIVHLALNNISI